MGNAEALISAVADARDIGGIERLLKKESTSKQEETVIKFKIQERKNWWWSA